MKAYYTQSLAKKLNDDNRVQTATPKQNNKGPYIEVEPTDTLAEHELRADLHKYPVFVDLTEAQ